MNRTRFTITRLALSAAFISLAFNLSSCSDDNGGRKAGVEGVVVSQPSDSLDIKGLFVLNEGQMDKNKCSLDYFDYTSGKFYNNLFAAINPDVTLGLGDTGNDLKVYEGRLYAVINGSGLIEVMDARTLRHVGSVALAGCRCIAFNGNKAYVTSYSGEMDENTKLQKGTLAEMDLDLLKITRTCGVGYQPEGVVVRNGKIYVANSCAYEPDYTVHYEKTVSVIDAETMTLEKNIDVAINMNTMQLDKHGNIYVISRGNYADVKSDVYVLNTNSDVVDGALNVRAASTCLAGDSLYIVGNEYSYATGGYESSFAIYDIKKKSIVSEKFITDGTDSRLVSPYGIAVNPENGDIFITDAGDYVNPGTLFCYNREGKLLWTSATGDIPGHLAFATQKVRGLE